MNLLIAVIKSGWLQRK